MKLRALIPVAAITLMAFAAQAQVYDGYNGDNDDQYCREFTKTIYIGGRPQPGYGTSCMQPDGSWQIVQAAQPRQQQYYAPQPATYVQPVQYVQYPQYPRPVYAAYYPRPYYRPAWPFWLSLNLSNWHGRDWHGHDNRGHSNNHNNDHDSDHHWHH